MATRDFTVIRRRANLVDILTTKRDNVKGYRLRAAVNFDDPFTTILTADISSGFLDPAVDQQNLHVVNNPNHIRIVFNPNTFTAAAGISDSLPFWLRFQSVDFAGAPGTEGARGLILPDSALQAEGRVVISGDAPNAVSVANSMRLDLPRRMQGIVIHNQHTMVNLFVAMQEGGPEVLVPPGGVREFKDGAQDMILVRGDGNSVPFSANFTNYLPL